jgi:hypothetical protein
MSSKRIKKNKPGGEDISRRQLLQGLGCGIAGGMLTGGLPKPAHATPLTLNSSTNPVFDVQLPSGTSLIPGGEASLINGVLFVRVTVNGTPDMQAFDVQSNQFAFSLSNLLPGGTQTIPPTPFTDPVSDGTFVYTANQQTLYQMDINGNALQTVPILTGATGSVVTMLLINSMQDLLCFSDGGFLSRFNVAAQQNVWAPISALDALNTGGITPTIMIDGSLAYVCGNQVDGVNGGLFSVNLGSGTAVNPSAPLLTVPKGTGAAYAQGILYISGTNGVVTAHSASTGQQIWQYPADSSTLNGPLLPPVCNAGNVLVADAAGILHVISQVSGTGSPVNLNSVPTPSSRMFLEDNIAYLSLGPSSSLTTFGITLDTFTPLSYPTNSAGVFVGVQNGVCYFSHNNGQNLAARSFTADLHGLFSESVLIEDYVPSSSGTVRTPTYRTHLQFLDSNYNPRVGKAIRIWASDQVQITSGQNTYTVDSTNGVWLTTDGSGELPIVVAPDNVTCPTLYVWNTYMLPGDAMMVYPDWDVTNTLANLQPTGTPGMPAANPWDNSPLFNQSNGTEAIAQSIRSSMSGGSQATAVRAQVKLQIANHHARVRTGHTTPPRATTESSYIAYPSVNPNMTFAPNYVNILPTRPFVPSASPSPWTVSVDQNGVWTYSEGASPTASGIRSFIHISFHDLLQKCVHDLTDVVQKVEATVEQATNVITHTITTLAGDITNVYQLTIDSLEAAAAVVSSVLTSALKTIDSAVKWLSYLFDWDTFVANGKTIADTATTKLQTFGAWIQGLTATDKTDIQNTFTSAENQVIGFLNSFMTSTGSTTIQSHQVANNNPQTAYAYKGAQSYSQTKWLSTKVQGNMGQASVATTTTATGSLDDVYSSILGAFESLLSSISSNLQTFTASNIVDDIKGLFDDLLGLFQNPSTFVTNTFNSILKFLGDVIVFFLQFIALVFESILDAIPKLFNALVSLLTTPLNIPLVGDIWKAIDNGNPLTMMNVVGLVISIPATLVAKAAGNSSAGTTAGSEPFLNFTLLFAGLFYTAVDTFSDLENFSSTGLAAWLGASLTLYTFAFSFVFANAPTDFFQGTYYPMTATPLALSALNIGINKLGSPAGQEVWNAALPNVNFFYGLVIIPFTIFAVAAGGGFLSVTSTLANIIGALPYVGKVLATGPAFQFPEYPQRAVPAAVDFLGDMGSTMLNTFGNGGL